MSDEKCLLASDTIADSILSYVAAYFVRFDGELDALVFVGAIDERAARLRREDVTRCACLGFKLDKENGSYGSKGDEVTDIGPTDCSPRVLIEEAVIQGMRYL